MLRASSPPPSQFPKVSQPDTPCKKQKTRDGHNIFCSPVPGFGVCADPDGCSTAAPSPMTAMHPSPWGTPWQVMASPDWRTHQDCPQQSFWKRTEVATLGCSTATCSPIPATYPSPWSAPWQGLASPEWCTNQDRPATEDKMIGLSAWSELAEASPPPELTEAAWLEVVSALNGQVVVQAESIAPGLADLPLQAPPETPRKMMGLPDEYPKTAPGAPKKITADASQMWRALESDSISEVRRILADDPDAAWTPFWECNFEPPLCRAARSISDPAIVSLLLEQRADVNAVDHHNQTPLALLKAAAETHRCCDLIPRSLFSEPSTESLPTSSLSREERVQSISRVLIQGGGIIGDHAF